MTDGKYTFGKVVKFARKQRGMSLKTTAAKIFRDDGASISVQYLHDIENDRRGASSDRMARQFAKALGLNSDWLSYLVGRFPDDIRHMNLTQEHIAKVMAELRAVEK